MGANVGQTEGNVGWMSGNLGQTGGIKGWIRGNKGRMGGNKGRIGGNKGWMPGNKGRMGGGRPDERTSGRRRMGADKQIGRRGRMGGMADGRTGGMANRGGRCRTDFLEGKTPQLTHQLTWPLEIQCGRSWVTIQTGHLP